MKQLNRDIIEAWREKIKICEDNFMRLSDADQIKIDNLMLKIYNRGCLTWAEGKELEEIYNKHDEN